MEECSTLPQGTRATSAASSSRAFPNYREQLYIRKGPFLLKHGTDMSQFKLPEKPQGSTCVGPRASSCRDGFNDGELGMTGQQNSKQAQRIGGLGTLPLFYHMQLKELADRDSDRMSSTTLN